MGALVPDAHKVGTAALGRRPGLRTAVPGSWALEPLTAPSCLARRVCAEALPPRRSRVRGLSVPCLCSGSGRVPEQSRLHEAVTRPVRTRGQACPWVVVSTGAGRGQGCHGRLELPFRGFLPGYLSRGCSDLRMDHAEVSQAKPQSGLRGPSLWQDVSPVCGRHGLAGSPGACGPSCLTWPGLVSLAAVGVGFQGESP